MVNGRLELKCHFRHINKKIGYLMNRLYPRRNVDNMRLNANMFKAFLVPLYRLCLAEYQMGNQTERKQILQQIKVKFKLFANLPINTPNHTVRMIIGDTR